MRRDWRYWALLLFCVCVGWPLRALARARQALDTPIGVALGLLDQYILQHRSAAFCIFVYEWQWRETLARQRQYYEGGSDA